MISFIFDTSKSTIPDLMLLGNNTKCSCSVIVNEYLVPFPLTPDCVPCNIYSSSQMFKGVLAPAIQVLTDCSVYLMDWSAVVVIFPFSIITLYCKSPSALTPKFFTL